jgi:hypothetical protein
MYHISRRSFLSGLGGASVIAAVPAFALAKPLAEAVIVESTSFEVMNIANGMCVITFQNSDDYEEKRANTFFWYRDETLSIPRKFVTHPDLKKFVEKGLLKIC